MKLLLVIDVADDVAKNYKALTVNYDLRGDYGEWDESIKYVEDTKPRPLPQKKNTSKIQGFGYSQIMWTNKTIHQNEGWNDCIDAILGETE